MPTRNRGGGGGVLHKIEFVLFHFVSENFSFRSSSSSSSPHVKPESFTISFNANDVFSLPALYEEKQTESGISIALLLSNSNLCCVSLRTEGVKGRTPSN